MGTNRIRQGMGERPLQAPLPEPPAPGAEQLARAAVLQLGKDPEDIVSSGRSGEGVYFTLSRWWLWEEGYRLVDRDGAWQIQRAERRPRYYAAGGCGYDSSSYDTYYEDAGVLELDEGMRKDAVLQTPDSGHAGDAGRPVADGGSADGGDVVVCEGEPGYFEGDGTHVVRPGDRITAANGVNFVFRGVGPDPETEDSFRVQYITGDFYAGETRLNQFPVQLYHDLCAEYYGVSFDEPFAVRETECGLDVQVKLRSTYPGPIASRQELYAACRESGNPHGQCSDFIPYEPAPHETIVQEGRFQVITPAEANPIIGPYYLRQLQLAYPIESNLFGVTEAVPAISLRWMYVTDDWFAVPRASQQIKWYPAWPATEGSEVAFIQGEETGGFANIAGHPIVNHELIHLLQYGMPIPYWLKEGMGMLAEQYGIERPPEHAPIFEGTVAMGAEFSVPGLFVPLTFSDYSVDGLGRKSAVLSPYSMRLDERSYVFLRENPGGYLTLTAEEITESDVAFRVFENVGVLRSDGWMWDTKILCLDEGYLDLIGVYIGSSLYASAYRASSDGRQLLPYVSLNSDVEDDRTPFYHTAFCLFDGVRNMYGEGAIHEFMRRADEVRQDNLRGIFTAFCATEALAEAAGDDLSEYYRRFDPPTGCFANFEPIPLERGFRICR